MLDRQYELRLFERWRDAGDRGAADEIVRASLPSVVMNISCTCQLPSWRLRESHCASSGLVPAWMSRSLTISPSRGPGPASPGPRTVARWASWARYARSASTGPSNRRTRSMGIPAASAISSAVSPARIRSWISLGRNGLSTSMSY